MIPAIVVVVCLVGFVLSGLYTSLSFGQGPEFGRGLLGMIFFGVTGLVTLGWGLAQFFSW